MKSTLKKAFLATVPVLTGYLVLGFGFGILVKAAGFGIPVAFFMSLLIYAGSMQYAAIGLITGGVPLLTVALTTVMVNARHLFYGISMLEGYSGTGRIKPYLIFALTDETYSLVCSLAAETDEKTRHAYYLWVSLLNHSYWVLGSLLGAVAGSLISFNSEGIDFALTALFITVFIEQWLSAKNHLPAICGVLVSVACLFIFGADSFLIPTMLILSALLIIYSLLPFSKEKSSNESGG